MNPNVPLLNPQSEANALQPEVNLPPLSSEHAMLADYQSTDLTLSRPPMALLRKHPAFRFRKGHNDLRALNNHRFVRIAGLVTGRQRTSMASGVVFLTLIKPVIWAYPALGRYSLRGHKGAQCGPLAAMPKSPLVCPPPLL